MYVCMYVGLWCSSAAMVSLRILLHGSCPVLFQVSPSRRTCIYRKTRSKVLIQGEYLAKLYCPRHSSVKKIPLEICHA